jgi:hypothetical protein
LAWQRRQTYIFEVDITNPVPVRSAGLAGLVAAFPV